MGNTITVNLFVGDAIDNWHSCVDDEASSLASLASLAESAITHRLKRDYPGLEIDDITVSVEHGVDEVYVDFEGEDQAGVEDSVRASVVEAYNETWEAGRWAD